MQRTNKIELNKSFCPQCIGEGDIKGKPCKKCHGTGWVLVDQVKHTDIIEISDEDDGEY